MALPSNDILEKLKDSINASDVGLGRKAADLGWYDLWTGMKDHQLIFTNKKLEPYQLFVDAVCNDADTNGSGLNATEMDEWSYYNKLCNYHHVWLGSFSETIKNIYDEVDDLSKQLGKLEEDDADFNNEEESMKLADEMDKLLEDVNTYNKLRTTWIEYILHWKSDLQKAKNNSSEFTNEEGKDVAEVTLTTEKAEDNIKNNEPVVSDISTNNTVTEAQKVESFKNTLRKLYEANDPRLIRNDVFFMDSEDDVNGLRIPFSSLTIASAFSDQTWKLEYGAAKLVANSYKDKIGIYKLLGDYKPDTNATQESSNIKDTTNSNNPFFGRDNKDKVIMNDTTHHENDDKNWGVQSIVNPYSLTKLCGGIENGANLKNSINYMYDIRDRRRFYGLSVNAKTEKGQDDPLIVSNPTVTLLIEWSNQDAWGRTPYSFLDFVFCKNFGIIPNNRLITLRRYSAPTYDNLQFENMFGNQEETSRNSDNEVTDSRLNAYSTEPKGTFSPHASVVTWFGGDSGNTLSSLMNFSTGINWEDLQAKIHEVSGDTGESPQLVIDKLLENGGNHTNLFGSAEYSGINSLLLSGSFVTSKITSYGKFALSLKGNIGTDQLAFDTLSQANSDPYTLIYANRVKGPLNRIEAVKKRKEGILFSLTLTVKCAYKAKAIGGINPKAALLDVLGNCLEMVSPHAVFWGGGHHFNIHPLIYPFHDGGWRDSFMKKIYDGKFLGNDGAISYALSGITKVGKDSNGNFSMDALKSNLGQEVGAAFNMVGAAISSLSSLFGGSNILDSLANGINNRTEATQADKDLALKRVNTLFGNLQNMWHNKMITSTMQPKVNGMGNLLVGEPVGEWHLTVGNPLNPIMVIGNLVCEKMDVVWDEELGPDDFPTGFEVTYSLQHGMARDSDAIQSMFNRGMGKYYTLPDYMECSSDEITYVDKYTKGGGKGDTGNVKWMSGSRLMEDVNEYGGGWQKWRIDNGQKPKNSGNPNTQLVTKFTPLNANPVNTLNVATLRNGKGGTVSMIKSLAATRKLS